jgi:hypothetical protein
MIIFTVINTFVTEKRKTILKVCYIQGNRNKNGHIAAINISASVPCGYIVSICYTIMPR